MERIIIEGDTVSLMQVQKEKTVSLKSFKEEFRKLVGVRTPIDTPDGKSERKWTGDIFLKFTVE